MTSRYCSFSLTSDLFARFTLGRGIAYLRTLDKDPLERMAIVPKLKQQLELISVSQVRSFASKWQLVCLKQWCLTNTIRASSASKSSRRKKSVLVTEIHSESTIPPPELTSEDYQSPKIEFHHSRSKGRGVSSSGYFH